MDSSAVVWVMMSLSATSMYSRGDNRWVSEDRFRFRNRRSEFYGFKQSKYVRKVQNKEMIDVYPKLVFHEANEDLDIDCNTQKRESEV